MDYEARLINAIVKKKELAPVLALGGRELFRSHVDAFDAIVDYYNNNDREIPSLKHLNEIVTDTVDDVEISGSTASYAQQAVKEYFRSALNNMFMTSAKRLKNESAIDVYNDVMAKLTRLARMTGSTYDLDLMNIDDAIEHYKKVQQQAAEHDGTVGIRTLIPAIDTAYHTGMAPGHLIVIIGWPSKGKTWFSALLGVNAWIQGYRVMIVSLEMSRETMRDRIYPIMELGYKNSELSRGAVDLGVFKKTAQERFKDKDQFIIVSGEGRDNFTPATVQAHIDIHKPDLVICDYHQLFDDDKGGKTEAERMQNISKSFKRMAVRNNIPVIDITAATMEDISDTDTAPILAQVRWAKSIEYDADMACSVHRDHNLIKVTSAKNRHGDDFAFDIDWDLDSGKRELVVTST